MKKSTVKILCLIFVAIFVVTAIAVPILSSIGI